MKSASTIKKLSFKEHDYSGRMHCCVFQDFILLSLKKMQLLKRNENVTTCSVLVNKVSQMKNVGGVHGKKYFTALNQAL